MGLLKQMMISVKRNDKNNFAATPEERAAITTLVERVSALLPYVQVRFVQRQLSATTVLCVGLITNNLESEEQQTLRAIPNGLDLPENLSVQITQSEYPPEEGQLLDIKSFLPKKRTVFAMQPKEVEIRWHSPYKRNLIFLAIFALGMQANNLVTHIITPYAGYSIKDISEHISYTLKSYDRDIEALKNSEPKSNKITKLENEKVVLENARKVLQEAH